MKIRSILSQVPQDVVQPITVEVWKHSMKKRKKNKLASLGSQFGRVLSSMSSICYQQLNQGPKRVNVLFKCIQIGPFMVWGNP